MSEFHQRCAASILFSCLSCFAATVCAANHAPTISGKPLICTTIDVRYEFKSKAADADGNRLGFSIRNKPQWATFDTARGILAGVPRKPATHSNIVISVTDGKASKSLPAFTIVVKQGNHVPTISGVAPTTAGTGQRYTFQPTAKDADGDRLRFSILNSPSWAALDPSTGRLSGTPSSTGAGKYSNITIRVSDGKRTVALAPFTITVGQNSEGSVTLSWLPPTENTDGTGLTNLAGYRIYYGTSAAVMNRTVQISNAGISTYVIEDLQPATYYFAVRAVNRSGSESDSSPVASKRVM
jgi:hypothetical protein